MKLILITLFFHLICSTAVLAEPSCVEIMRDFINNSGDVFSRLQPDDWVHVRFENGDEFTGRFKYITEDAAVFIDLSTMTHVIKIDHIEKADIEFLYPN